MDFREHPVPEPIRPIVETIWTLEADGGAGAGNPQPVLPDGRAEIIVHFGDRFERVDAGVATAQPLILIAGQIERPLVLRPTGRMAVLGVRLRPAGAAALMSVPQHELVGLTEDARNVSPPLAAWLREVRETAESLDAAAAMVGSGIARLMRLDRVDPRALRASAVIDRTAGRARVEQVAAHVCLTRRQLERLFRAQVGIGPKRLMRIRRLQRALQVLDAADPDRPGGIAALASGYADQAHFVRDCRAIAGYTPGAHLLRQAELTGLLMDRRPPAGRSSDANRSDPDAQA